MENMEKLYDEKADGFENKEFNLSEKIIEENGRRFIITSNGKFALCKKCGHVLGSHDCKPTLGLDRHRLTDKLAGDKLNGK